MARKRGYPKAIRRRDVVVKLDAILVGKAQMVAKAKGNSLAEYLSEIIRGPVDRDFLKLMKQMAADSDAEARDSEEKAQSLPPRPPGRTGSRPSIPTSSS